MQFGQQQMQVLASRRDDVYVRETVRYYRFHFPSVALGVDDELARRVWSALKVAREIGLPAGDPSTIFVNLAIQAGPDFIEQPDIRRFLCAPGCEPERQLRLLLARVLDLIGQACRHYGVSAK